MDIEKIPRMIKEEYDDLIEKQYMCRISFMGAKYPLIKPFLYHFDGNYIYVLATKYGEKIKYLKENPPVTIEIERYSPDLSDYKFVTLSGRLVKLDDEDEKKNVRKEFVRLIKDRDLSKNVMFALGHSKEEPVEAIAREDRTLVLKLVEVEDITGLRSRD